MGLLTLLFTMLYQPQHGLDLLGLAKINPQIVIDNIKDNYAIGFLDGTFGDPYPHLKIILDSGKVTAVRVHLIDAACLRNHSCVGVRNLKLRAQKLALFANNYKSVHWYVSPYLEHDEKNPRVVVSWYKTLRKYAPFATPVCSAFTGWCPPHILSEHHNNTLAAIVSNDGASIFDAPPSFFKLKPSILFGWDYSFNGRVKDGVFITPKKRKAWPSSGTIKRVVRLLEQ